MDGTTFDAIVKRLGSATDRRRVLAGLLSGALSGAIGGRDIEAKRKTAKDKDSKRKTAREKDSRRKSSGRKKLPDSNADADQLTVSATTIPDCNSACRIVEGVAGSGAGRFCRASCPGDRHLAVLLIALVEQELIKAGQILEILQRFFAEGVIGSANEFRRLVEQFVRDGLIALCGGDLRRLCISGSGEIACCDRGQACTNGACQCPPNQVRCGNACLERCPSNEVRDPTRNCECVCASGLRRCGGLCRGCPRGQRLNQETCECRCLSGETCGEECVPSCPTGLAYDAETCDCTCAADATGCCVSDQDCGDSNVCTQERCDLATNRCLNQAIDGCCRQDSECTTANPCTRDTCNQSTNTCDHAPIAGCCRNDGECGTCERCSDQNTCVADRAKDTTSCTVGDATGACCNGTCTVCAAGQTLDVETCGCTGGGGETCVCTRGEFGDSCELGTDCCSGACGDPFEDQLGFYCHDFYDESFCADGGTFCANDADGANHCCSDVCTNCVCEDFVCREVGDPDCRLNRHCCGSAVCVSTGCCIDRGELCSGLDDCCSGSCEDFFGDGNRYCACGAVGSPCTRGGQCCSETCGPEGVCTCSPPEHGTLPCRVDADCCGGRCRNGVQAPDDGADGVCCRFAGEDCQFPHECCSGSCNVDLSTCNE